MAAAFGNAQTHRTVDRAETIGRIAGCGHDANLAGDFTLFGIVGHVVHVGPVESKSRIAVGEGFAHVLFQIFARSRVGQALIKRAFHQLHRLQRGWRREIELTVVIEFAAEAGDQRGVVTHQRFRL